MRNKLSALQFQDKIFIAYGLIFLVMFLVVFGSTRLLIWFAFRGEIDTYVEKLQGTISNNYQVFLNKVQKDVQAASADEELHQVIARRGASFAYRPSSTFDLFEYGTPDGKLLYPNPGITQNAQTSHSTDKRKGHIVLRDVPQQRELGQLFVLQATEAGEWGFFTGGYTLQTWLETTQTSIQSDEHPVFLVRKSEAAAGTDPEVEAGGIAPEDWLPLNIAARNVPLAARNAFIEEGTEEAAGSVYTASRITPFHSAFSTIREGPPVDLVVAYSHARQEVWKRQVTLILFVSGAIGLALVYLISYIISRRITRPIAILREGVSHIAAGNLDHRVDIRSRNEVGQLAEGFNQMARDLKQSLEERMAAERAATWRDAARQVAHEIKNPLFPIRLSVENLLAAKSNPEFFEQIFDVCTDTVIEEVDRIGKLIDEFHQFARMPKPVRSWSQLNDVVKSVLTLYTSRYIPESKEGTAVTAMPPTPMDSMLPESTDQFWLENVSKIEVETQLAPLPRLFIDSEQIAQALGNLLKNAIEAMPDGGLLTVKTAFTPKIPAVQETSENAPMDTAGTVLLEIQDTGQGMSEETQTNLFVPYYTTKSEANGRGLGMPIVGTILTEHNAEIHFQSNEGVGTTVYIRFPHDPSTPPKKIESDVEALTPHGRGVPGHHSDTETDETYPI